MNSPTSQFITSRRMGIYDEFNQISMWADFKGNGFLNPPPSMIMEDNNQLDNQSEDTSQGTPSNKYDHEETRRADKVLRRLAQNREAARKSRLRKKAYVQQLESSRLKLVQMEQELERARQQGLYVGGGLDTSNLGYPGTVNPVIVTFEMEYGHWVEEQNKQICELKTALSSSSNLLEIELRILVDSVMNHYSDLFRMKAKAAKADIFYLITGLWKTSAERFFLWIGGFRPSEILKVLLPQLDPLTDEQLLNIYHLRQSCQQAEDALSQGMEKLQLNVAETVVANHMGEGSYLPQVGKAMEKLEALACFVNQADHLRQETLQQMSRILTVPQAARGLLALGEYCQRLRALSSLWATRLREPA